MAIVQPFKKVRRFSFGRPGSLLLIVFGCLFSCKAEVSGHRLPFLIPRTTDKYHFAASRNSRPPFLHKWGNVQNEKAAAAFIALAENDDDDKDTDDDDEDTDDDSLTDEGKDIKKKGKAANKSFQREIRQRLLHVQRNQIKLSHMSPLITSKLSNKEKHIVTTTASPPETEPHTEEEEQEKSDEEEVEEEKKIKA